MTLTREQVTALLAAAAAYDRRKPNPDTVMAWTKAAEIGRWTYEAALEAVHEHYARTDEWLMPAHITRAVRATREQPPALELPAPDPAAQAHVDAVIAEVARRLAWPDHDQITASDTSRRDVVAQRCTYCGAHPGDPCTRPTRTGGNVATRFHPARIEAAGVAS